MLLTFLLQSIGIPLIEIRNIFEFPLNVLTTASAGKRIDFVCFYIFLYIIEVNYLFQMISPLKPVEWISVAVIAPAGR